MPIVLLLLRFRLFQLVKLHIGYEVWEDLQMLSCCRIELDVRCNDLAILHPFPMLYGIEISILLKDNQSFFHQMFQVLIETLLQKNNLSSSNFQLTQYHTIWLMEIWSLTRLVLYSPFYLFVILYLAGLFDGLKRERKIDDESSINFPIISDYHQPDYQDIY